MVAKEWAVGGEVACCAHEMQQGPFQQELKRPFLLAVERARKPYFTRIPGFAPLCGSRIYKPGSAFSSSEEAASTMPSDSPNFILRGARFATITVNFPIRSCGCYADLIPENTLRVFSSPTSNVSCSSLSDPSTAVQFTIFAIRRSILAKSSMEITPSACGSFTFAACFDAEAEAAAAGTAAACPGATDSR